MPDSVTSADAPGRHATRPSLDALLTLGTTVLSGIGVIGLVTVAGGEILYFRFRAAHFPAEQAVSVVPKTQLLTVGAEVLAPLTLAILAAMLVVRALVIRFDGREAIRSRLRWQIAVGVAFVIATLVYYVIAEGGVHRLLSLVVVALIAAAATAGVGLVGFRTDRDWGWFAAAVIVAIAGVASGISWKRNSDQPEARPAALVTFHSAGISAFFVTETSDAVYLARVTPVGRESNQGIPGTGRLIVLPRDQVKELSIGELEPLAEARRQGPLLLRELQSCASQTGCNGAM
jgi:hypothetical protein